MSIVIYGKEFCNWCDRAVEVCIQYELAYIYKSLDDRFSGQDTYAELQELAIKDNIAIKTVPQIWWNGKHIGGYSDLITAIENSREYGQGGF
jgi:glutaredoxin 3